MLLVKTMLKPSKIHGIGVFAAQNIRKGTVVWKFNPAIDKKFSEDEIALFPEVARKQVIHYSYRDAKGQMVLCGDDARFFNHSDSPSCNDPDEETTIATRDIKEGEELTSNYLTFDHGFVEKIREIKKRV